MPHIAHIGPIGIYTGNSLYFLVGHVQYIICKMIGFVDCRHMFKSVPPGLWVIGLRMRLSNAKWEVPQVLDAADRVGRPTPSPAVVTIRSRAKYSEVRFDHCGR